MADAGREHRENALLGSSLLHAGMGSFDFAGASLREASAALKMTMSEEGLFVKLLRFRS